MDGSQQTSSLSSSQLVEVIVHGSGGLALVWKDEVELEVLASCENFIDCNIIFQKKVFRASFIYGDTDKSKRKLVWNELTSRSRALNKPWILTGDFNDIISNEDKTGGQIRPEGSFIDFRSFLAENDLFDLHHSGDSLSWRGKRYGQDVRCRLDRTIANTLWDELFPTARCHYLRFEGSDHRPLITYVEPEKKNKRGLFRYDRRLSNNPEVQKLIKEVWDLVQSRSVEERIDAVRRALIDWNKQKHTNNKEQIEKLKAELEARMTDSVVDAEAVKEINTQLKQAYDAEEAYWKQRSRIMWLQMGDRNTGFFHATTRGRRMINRFTVMESETGEIVHEEQEITSVIEKYFQNLFTSSGTSNRETVQKALTPIISEEENALLVKDPSPDEITKAVFSINADKAPGPDGFSASFFHSNWKTVGPKIIFEVQQFFKTSVMPPSLNATHVRLIPKVQNPKKVSEYRPIALCNIHYKIISKLLTKRLQPLLTRLISETQSAFVPGRAISDNVLITHEVLHYLKNSQAKKHCYMAVKTDMSKAYDRLEWSFVEEVFKRLGFHSKWIKWVMQCITTVSYSFLVNGSARGEVIPSRGIRQGDPLSPYIFILCSEVLSGLCLKAMEEGQLKGIRVAKESPRINHLLFADDTMFFCKANRQNCLALKGILASYEEVSGQKINDLKSSISFSRKTPLEIKEEVKEILHIPNEGGVGKYLGLPEHFGRRKRDLFTSIVDRIRQRAIKWSTRFLSKAGKLVLLKSVLSSIPTYAMSCFILPLSLCKRIQSVLTRFWWDTKTGDKKMAWIAWNKLTRSKKEGGLGFRDVHCFNVALLAKLAWRILEQPNGLLARILTGKYCSQEDFLQCSPKANSSHGWSGILMGRNLLIKHLGWEVGNGKSILAWKEPWLYNQEIHRPLGPIPENQQGLTVHDLLTSNGRDWDVDKIRSVFPCYETEILCKKLSYRDLPDKRVWTKKRNGCYSTRTGYMAAREDLGNDVSSGFSNHNAPPFDWLSKVWKLETSPKLKLFIWNAANESLAVSERLAQRHIPVDQNCKRCGQPESITHFFFTCSFAQQVWASTPVYPMMDSRNCVNFKSCWPTFLRAKTLPPVGLTQAPIAPWLLWTIWLSRNGLVFEGKAYSPEDTITKAIVLAKEWEVSQMNKPKQDKIPQTYIQSTTSQVPVIQTDASWRESDLTAGLGWVIKEGDTDLFNSESTMHARYVVSPLVAECLAMREGIYNAKRLGLKSIRVESDCLQLITAINTISPLLHLYSTLEDIQRLKTEFEYIVFKYIPRSQNCKADRLTKQALSLTIVS